MPADLGLDNIGTLAMERLDMALNADQTDLDLPPEPMAQAQGHYFAPVNSCFIFETPGFHDLEPIGQEWRSDPEEQDAILVSRDINIADIRRGHSRVMPDGADAHLGPVFFESGRVSVLPRRIGQYDFIFLHQNNLFLPAVSPDGRYSRLDPPVAGAKINFPASGISRP